MKACEGALAGFETDLHALLDTFAVTNNGLGVDSVGQVDPASTLPQPDIAVATFAHFKELWVSRGFSYIHQVRDYVAA